MGFRIVITEASGASRTEVFDKDVVTLGRAASNDVVLPGLGVSERHARIEVQAGRFVLVDQGSTNGTHVNGTRLDGPRRLEETDRVRIGNVALSITQESAPADPDGSDEEGTVPDFRPGERDADAGLTSPERALNGEREVRARVAAQFGDASAQALAAALHEQKTDARGRRRPRWEDVWIEGSSSCFWVRASDQTVPVQHQQIFVADGPGWRKDFGLDAWSATCVAFTVDVTRAEVREEVLAAFGALVGPVLRNDDDVRALVAPLTPEQHHWKEPPVPADPAVGRLFEPPHFEGDVFVFHAHVRSFSDDARVNRGPSFLRVALDAVSLAVDVTRLCRGQFDGLERHFVLRGRAYVDDAGQAVLAAAVDDDGDEVVHATDTGVPDASLDPAAQAWWHAARQEHASIASFARAALELLALGAPLDLVARMHEAALDEVRHAVQSLAIARRFDARVPTTFAPLPALAPRALDRAALAAVTLHEAACPETLATAVARAAAAACDDDDIRAVLQAIAVDEARHAALAWDIVAWCGGAVVDPSWFAPDEAPPSFSVDDRCGQLMSRSLGRAMQAGVPELRARATTVASAGRGPPETTAVSTTGRTSNSVPSTMSTGRSTST